MIIDRDKILDLYDIEVSCLELANEFDSKGQHYKELMRISDITSSLASHMKCSLRLQTLNKKENNK